mmetsp:Transcript_43531/g.92553  ORF Transcript_43531/g.92553 Transcript_43531/m.92553 type:complete len:121 (-) Transcript_43531:87-449(-)
MTLCASQHSNATPRKSEKLIAQRYCVISSFSALSSSAHHVSRSPQRRRNQHDNISSHEQHPHAPRLFIHYFFSRFFVLFRGRDGLFHLAKDHVEVLIVRMKPPPQLPIVAAFDVDAFVYR